MSSSGRPLSSQQGGNTRHQRQNSTKFTKDRSKLGKNMKRRATLTSKLGMQLQMMESKGMLVVPQKAHGTSERSNSSEASNRSAQSRTSKRSNRRRRRNKKQLFQQISSKSIELNDIPGLDLVKTSSPDPQKNSANHLKTLLNTDKTPDFKKRMSAHNKVYQREGSNLLESHLQSSVRMQTISSQGDLSSQEEETKRPDCSELDPRVASPGMCVVTVTRLSNADLPGVLPTVAIDLKKKKMANKND